VVLFAGATWPAVVSAEASSDVALELDTSVLGEDGGKTAKEDGASPDRLERVVDSAESGDASDELGELNTSELLGAADGIDIDVARTVA
jgi:hypothetical protein